MLTYLRIFWAWLRAFFVRPLIPPPAAAAPPELPEPQASPQPAAEPTFVMIPVEQDAFFFRKTTRDEVRL